MEVWIFLAEKITSLRFWHIH